MKKLGLIISCVFLIGIGLSAQQTDSLVNHPGQVTFFYPMGTNGIDATKYSNNFSFNILYGINGGFNGIEFGGILNTNLGDVNGAQFAGIANINTKKANGVIFGGISNILKDSSNALCFAGISNIIGSSAIGLHFAGISNIANGNFNGGQFAGISNVINGNFKGLQIAGISNLTTGRLIGSQIGLINMAKNVTGFQLGLINIAESFEHGAPLGLVSYVKDGFHAIEFSGGEAIYGNMSVKLGIDNLYTIYKLGYAANGSDNYWTYGFGLGGMVGLSEKAKISIDLSGNHIVESKFTPRLNILSRADLAFRYHLGDHIGFFAGPSFNVYVSEHAIDSEIQPLDVPYVLYSENWWNNEGTTSMWIGANIGLSIMF